VIESGLDFSGGASEDCMYRLSQMRFDGKSIHGGQCDVDGSEPQLSITDSNADGGTIKQRSE
jgi:hypothetical protein